MVAVVLRGLFRGQEECGLPNSPGGASQGFHKVFGVERVQRT